MNENKNTTDAKAMPPASDGSIANEPSPPLELDYKKIAEAWGVRKLTGGFLQP